MNVTLGLNQVHYAGSYALYISPGAIVKNQAPHVNFCYSVVLRSYGCRVSEKSGWHFFKQCSRSFGGH